MIPTHIEFGDEYDYENWGDGWEKEIAEAKRLKKNENKVVLIPNQEFTLKIDYPLSTPAKFKFKSGKKGITTKQLIKKIREFYKKVYDEEDSSANSGTGHIPGMLNRDFSDGKYGIWGHDIGDLVLVEAKVSNKNVITLGVDS